MFVYFFARHDRYIVYLELLLSSKELPESPSVQVRLFFIKRRRYFTNLRTTFGTYEELIDHWPSVCESFWNFPTTKTVLNITQVCEKKSLVTITNRHWETIRFELPKLVANKTPSGVEPGNFSEILIFRGL